MTAAVKLPTHSRTLELYHHAAAAALGLCCLMDESIDFSIDSLSCPFAVRGSLTRPLVDYRCGSLLFFLFLPIVVSFFIRPTHSLVKRGFLVASLSHYCFLHPSQM
jgi:hypothetical protein